MEKGFLENPKYSSYMVSQSSNIDLGIGFFQSGIQYTRNEIEKEAWREPPGSGPVLRPGLLGEDQARDKD